MEYNLENPARRLHLLLQAGQQKNANQNCKSVWHELLGTAGNDPLLWSRIGKLMEVPLVIEQTRAGLAMPMPAGSGHWVAQFNAAFSAQNLNGAWNSFIGSFDPHAMNYLENVAVLIDAFLRVKSPSAETLVGLKKHVDDFIEVLIHSDVYPPDLKKFLVAKFREIRVRIEEHFLTGSTPIAEEIDSTFGYAFRNVTYREFLKDKDRSKDLFDALGVISDAVTIAGGVASIPGVSDAVKQLL